MLSVGTTHPFIMALRSLKQGLCCGILLFSLLRRSPPLLLLLLLAHQHEACGLL